MTVMISVIIPTYRDDAILPLCVAALKEQSIPATAFEVIVVNNDPSRPVSTDGWPGNMRVIAEGKPGSYAARNAGLAVARGQYVAFTDADCVPDRDWLERGLAVLEAHPDARVTGPVPIFRAEGARKYVYLYDFHVAFRQEESSRRGECVTANLMVSADAFRTAGPFNANLLSGGDFEWNRRAQSHGIPLIFGADVVVRHPSRIQFRELFRKRRRTARSEAKILKMGISEYVKHRWRPPVNSLRLDRAPVSSVDRATLITLRWLLNLWAITQFSGVRLGLLKPTRS